MALSYKNDQQGDERLDPYELKAREQQAGSHEAIPGYDRKSDGLDDHPVSAGVADGTQTSKNIDDVKAQEDNPYDYQSSGRSQDSRSFKDKAVSFMKSKKGAATTIGGGFGITGIIISSLFGTFSLFPNLQANAGATNDTRSSILERRLVAAIKKKFGTSGSKACDLAQYRCRLGRMPNKMLNRLADNGIVASDEHGNPIERGSDTGYADRNPEFYRYEDPSFKNGFEVVKAENIASKFENDAKFRAKFKLAENMRFRAWVGKTIKSIFYDRFGIKNDGGVIDDDKKDPKTIGDDINNATDPEKAAQETPSDIKKPPEVTEDAFKSEFKGIIKDALKQDTKSSDAALITAALVCTTQQVPLIVANMYRDIQLAQILLLVSNVVLSPAGKIKAGDATPDQVSALGTALTKTVNGKSALDSTILLSALGVNKNRTDASKYAPGYKLYSSPLVQGSATLSSKTKNLCNKVESPEAQAIANSIEVALDGETLGIASLATKIGGVVAKVAITYGAMDLLFSIPPVKNLVDGVAKLAYEGVKKYAGDFTKGAEGLQLGDALGTGIFAYYSISGLSSGAGVLKTNQVADFSRTMSQVNNEYRQEDIATLSPFDTSSQYTFLGSIVSNLSLTGALSGSPLSSLASIGTMALSIPSNLLTPAVGASTDEDVQAAVARCSHADMFNLDSGLAINAAGYPCVGIPSQYLDTDPDTVAADAFSDNGSGIDQNTGEWTQDSKIGKWNADCRDASLTAVGGCTIDDSNAADAVYPFDKNVSDILDGTDDNPPASTTSVQSNGQSTSFTVASYNMCHSGNGHSNCNFSGKPQMIANNVTGSGSLNNPQFDIIGGQEVDIPTHEAILATGQYGSFPDQNNLPENQGRAVYWNKSKFNILGSGRIGGVYSNEGTWIPNASSQYAYPWVKLQSLANGTIVYVVSAQPPFHKPSYGNADFHKNAVSAQAIVNWESKLNIDSNTLVIVTGDMNSKAENSNTVYCTLTKSGNFQYAQDLIANRDPSAICPDKGIHLDQIYTSTNLSNGSSITASNWGYVDAGTKNTKSSGAGSDHSPAWVTYTINPSGSTGSGGSATPGKGFLGPEGFTSGQCVAYVEHILSNHASKYHGGSLTNQQQPGYHAAYTVAANLGKLGYRVDHTPAVHATVSFKAPYGTTNTTSGHVAIVSEVDPDGSIWVEEANYTYSGPSGGPYDKRHITDKAIISHATYAHTEEGWK